MLKATAIVTAEGHYETLLKLSNGSIINYLE